MKCVRKVEDWKKMWKISDEKCLNITGIFSALLIPQVTPAAVESRRCTAIMDRIIRMVCLTEASVFAENISNFGLIKVKKQLPNTGFSPPNCLALQGWAQEVSSAGFHSLWTCRKEYGTSLAGPSPSAPTHPATHAHRWNRAQQYYRQISVTTNVTNICPFKFFQLFVVKCSIFSTTKKTFTIR